MHKDNFFTTGQYTFLPRFCFQGRSKDKCKKKKKKSMEIFFGNQKSG